MQAKSVNYTWPDLSPVVRQYVVRDDKGRYGIAWTDEPERLTAHPIDVPPKIAYQSAHAILLTTTVWHLADDGTYTGIWYDDDGPIGPIAPDRLRRLTIIQDLGYYLPDKWSDRLLAGSDQMGHWDYGATIAYIPPQRPVKGQRPNEITIREAAEYTREVGEPVSPRGLRKACRAGHIPGARKAGRDWLLTYEGLNHYLDNRPKPGPKKS